MERSISVRRRSRAGREQETQQRESTHGSSEISLGLGWAEPHTRGPRRAALCCPRLDKQERMTTAARRQSASAGGVGVDEQREPRDAAIDEIAHGALAAFH